MKPPGPALALVYLAPLRVLRAGTLGPVAHHTTSPSPALVFPLPSFPHWIKCFSLFILLTSSFIYFYLLLFLFSFSYATRRLFRHNLQYRIPWSDLLVLEDCAASIRRALLFYLSRQHFRPPIKDRALSWTASTASRRHRRR